ncbi:MAG: amidase domain-containing protein [Clostridiales bacterium]|jgi:hypothetical protein|nr:amidase domain-containing protein [Clostridiales bacterium]
MSDLTSLALEMIKESLDETYKGKYAFDSFSVKAANEVKLDGKTCVDIDVSVNMTLTQNPADSSYSKGMKKAYSGLVLDREKDSAKTVIEACSDDAGDCYAKPQPTSILYRLAVDDEFASSGAKDACRLYSRVDIVSSETILTPVGEVRLKSEDYYFALGESQIDHLAVLPAAAASRAPLKYNRLAARDYAKLHGPDAPELSKSIGQSDCANFVSKSVNSGNIPEDPAGGWYRCKTYGNFYTGGVNWFRTGYYRQSNGVYEGVATYLARKGYFYQASSVSSAFAGGILFVTNASHVALVTYGDTVVVKYTDHSNIKVSHVDVLLQPSNYLYRCKFFLPVGSLM